MSVPPIHLTELTMRPRRCRSTFFWLLVVAPIVAGSPATLLAQEAQGGCQRNSTTLPSTWTAWECWEELLAEAANKAGSANGLSAARRLERLGHQSRRVAPPSSLLPELVRLLRSLSGGSEASSLIALLDQALPAAQLRQHRWLVKQLLTVREPSAHDKAVKIVYRYCEAGAADSALVDEILVALHTSDLEIQSSALTALPCRASLLEQKAVEGVVWDTATGHKWLAIQRLPLFISAVAAPQEAGMRTRVLAALSRMARDHPLAEVRVTVARQAAAHVLLVGPANATKLLQIGSRDPAAAVRTEVLAEIDGAIQELAAHSLAGKISDERWVVLTTPLIKLLEEMSRTDPSTSIREEAAKLRAIYSDPRE